MQQDTPLEIDTAELQSRLAAGRPVAVLDVREGWEREICAIAGSSHIPLGQLIARAGELPAEGDLVVYCHHGGRSLQAALWLRQHGFPRAASLAGGIDDWALTVEPGLARY
ncbi:MAG: rhodanese-like domain-containing protein [Dongiaceae bacterium]